MSIVFFGASKLGYACCKAIIDSGINVKAIFTIPKDFSIKYKEEKERRIQTNVLYKDFSLFTSSHGIPVHYVEGNTAKYEDYLIGLNPVLFIIIGWYYMIPEKILNIPSKGSVAIHASLLPKYRGNAPLVWALINGEHQTGVSLFYLEGGMDEGDIVEQKVITINKKDTIRELLKKVEDASLKMIRSNVPLLLTDKAPRIKQLHSEATYYPKRTPDDGEINWDWDSKRIKNFIGAQTRPYPGAFTIINGKKVIIWDAEIQDKLNNNHENADL